MRNPNRLYNTYNYLMYVHMQYFPDLRLGQFFELIKDRIYKSYRQDLFYIEDEDLLNKIQKFIDSEFMIKAVPINEYDNGIDCPISTEGLKEYNYQQTIKG